MKNANGVLNFHVKVDNNLKCLGENLESVGTGSVSNIGRTGETFSFIAFMSFLCHFVLSLCHFYLIYISSLFDFRIKLLLLSFFIIF